jgi:hypothetical protein
LTFLHRSVEFRAKQLASGVFKVSDIRADILLYLSGKDFAVAHLEAKRIEVADQEPAFPLGKHVDCFGLVSFHRGDRLCEHRLRLVSRAGLLRE